MGPLHAAARKLVELRKEYKTISDRVNVGLVPTYMREQKSQEIRHHNNKMAHMLDVCISPIRQRIFQFLRNPRFSKNGCWCEVTDNEIKTLRDIIRAIIELKYEKNRFGEPPVEVILVNRDRTNRMEYIPVPYSSHEYMHPTDAEKLDHAAMLTLVANLKKATEELQQFIIEQSEKIDRENEDVLVM